MSKKLSALLAEGSAKVLALAVQAQDHELGVIIVGEMTYGSDFLGQLGRDMLELSEQLEKAGR